MRSRPWWWMPVAVLGAVLLLAFAELGDARAEPETPDHEDVTWWTVEDGDVVVDLYFVWSSTCPHCRKAHPFIEALEAQYPWLRVHWLQADGDDPSAATTAVAVADSIGETITGLPAFLFCRSLHTGFDDADGIGARLEADLLACRAGLEAAGDPTPSATTTTEADGSVTVPIIGTVEAADVSLPMFTVAIAAVDAFNPCAFFVLLFLLSLLVHAASRVRMAVIGGVFVLFSGLIYFALMAAWLNVFLVTGSLRWITMLAGAVAVTLALINIKDYAAPGGTLSLSIPEGAKPGLIKRMRTLVAADRYPAMLAGTVTLAVAANSYELLCTAGLPMAFTRVLTLRELSSATYYSYLVLYNVVYVIPLMLIVGAFVWALGSRKLQAHEGRALKLLSGTMMLGLGGVLLFAPDLLDNLATALVILALAILVTLVVTGAERWRSRHGRAIPH